MFPHGLPEEFTLIFTLALKKAALRDTIYLFQISDQQGYPQVQLPVCFLIAGFALCCLFFLLSLLLLALLSLSLSDILFFTSLVYSFLSSLISLLHSHPLSSSIYFLSWHLFNSLPIFPYACPLSSLVLCLISLSLCLAPHLAVALPSIIFCSPLSFTFIVIHVCFMMKRWRPRESP